MLRSRLDRAFVRYARTGDPGALARVFDGCAGELYRIGFHLLGDRHAAEDLVQRTFVVAIEQAKSFDGSRRVLPWLCGILTNRALHLRRQAKHRSAVPVAGRDDVVDPVAAAAAREVSERVAAAVRALPEPYRQVLLLHLVHELTPKEVAEALARPDATVRTQLARGLDLLRRVLPVGFAGFAAGQIPPPLGLAAVRASVLAHAAQAMPVAVAAAAGVEVIAFTGVVAMKKVLIAVVAVLALLSSWLWWRSDPALPASVDARDGVAANAVAQQVPMPSSPLAANDAPRTEAPEVVDPNTAALDVLVRWHDGTPAADIPVRVRPRPFAYQSWLRVVRTGDDGVARFKGLPPGGANALTGRGVNADIDLAAGSAQRTTITLGEGIDVRGRVVDLDGRGFAGATVWMSVVSSSDDSEPIAISAADGSFTIRAAGRDHVVTATARGFATARVVSVSQQELVLSMRPVPGVLCGTVVDALGRPVADARLMLGFVFVGQSESGIYKRILGEVTSQDFWPARFLRTDADGRFRCEGLPPWKWPLYASAPDHAPWWSQVQVLDVGETEVIVELTRGATLRGRVADAAGVAIAGAEVVVSSQLPEVDRRISLGLSPFLLCGLIRASTDANGLYELRQLMPGKLAMAAYCEPNSARHECELQVGETVVWDPVLLPAASKGQPLHGTVVDEDGKPLENWTIQVDRNEGPPRSYRVPISEGGAFRTNHVAAGVHRLFVAPRSPLIGDEVDLGTFDSANCPLRLVVPRDRVPTGMLRGCIVVPAAQQTATCYLWVATAVERQRVQIPIDTEGRYEAGPLQRGSYLLRVKSSTFGEVAVGRIDISDGKTTDAGTFQIPTPGTLVVRIVDAAGKRVPDAWVDALPIGDDSRGCDLRHRDGIARGNLPAGRWLVHSCTATTMAAMEVDVRSGETTDVQFVIPDGVAFVLRVPAAARECFSWHHQWRDANGSLVRDGVLGNFEFGKDNPLRAPAGRYTLCVIDARGAKTSTTFDLRASDPPQIVELPLPAK